MTTYLIRNLRQTVTYWAGPTEDGWGGATFTVPTPIDGRWEDKQELFVNLSGQEEKSQAVVYVGQDVDLGGYLYLGTSTEGNPKDQSGALEIKAFEKTPSLRADVYLRKIWL